MKRSLQNIVIQLEMDSSYYNYSNCLTTPVADIDVHPNNNLHQYFGNDPGNIVHLGPINLALAFDAPLQILLFPQFS